MYWRFMALLGDLSPVIGQEAGGAAAGTGDAAANAAGAVADAANGAQEAGGGLFGNPLLMILFYGVIIVGAYFLLMRPQRKREKKAKEMQASIRTGDNVVTSAGLFGRVADVGEDCFIIEFGTNRGIRIPVLKSDVVAIRSPKTTPAPKELIEKKDP